METDRKLEVRQQELMRQLQAARDTLPSVRSEHEAAHSRLLDKRREARGAMQGKVQQASHLRQAAEQQYEGLQVRQACMTVFFSTNLYICVRAMCRCVWLGSGATLRRRGRRDGRRGRSCSTATPP